MKTTHTVVSVYILFIKNIYFLYMHKNSESMHKKYKQWLSLIKRLAVEMLLLKGVRNERKWWLLDRENI